MTAGKCSRSAKVSATNNKLTSPLFGEGKPAVSFKEWSNVLLSIGGPKLHIVLAETTKSFKLDPSNHEV